MSGLEGITPIDREVTFGRDEIIVSKTDTKGVITYANDVFLRVAGYSEAELIGQPHNVIRHPTSPAASSSCCGTRSRRARRSSRTCRTWPRTAPTTGCWPT